MPYTHIWDDTILGTFSKKWYVVQTNTKVIERAMLMTTEPGDLVLDPTCGSGTTAICAETQGRRWITCDTSRVAINIARKRLLSVVLKHYKTRGGSVGSGFVYETAKRITVKSLAYDLEPERLDLVDRPVEDKTAIRVAGPFEVMTLGRYSVEDWSGYVAESGKLENYISVVARLYRPDAAIQGTTGFIHAVAETESLKIAISVGPLSGRVSARQINDAVEDALALGILEVHVLGWAFEANVGEIKAQREARGKVRIELVMIRPDTLADGLKVTKADVLFSPLTLPDLEVLVTEEYGGREAVVRLKGAGVYDRTRRTTDYYRADSGYVAAWYLDEDYDGDCFVDCQMFFNFTKAPNLKSLVGVDVENGEYRFQTVSQPFVVRNYKRIAVKVVDIYGNESTVVKALVGDH
jgi:adenine-specific DNA-methyltransferase